MRSLKNLLILFLGFTTVAGAYLSWQQYHELVGLRAEVLAAQQRDTWRQRTVRAVAPPEPASPAPDAAALADGDDDDHDDAPPAPDARRGRPDSRSRGNFLENPNMQKLMALQQRGALDGRYAPLFKKLNLSPAQLEQFKNLLVDKQAAMMDVLAAARAQGINPRTNPEEFRQLVAQTQAELDNNIRSLLGDASYGEYQNYQQTLPQRHTVDQFAQRLSYTDTPLTSAQSDQLVQILAQTASRQNQGNATFSSRPGNFFAAMGGPAGATSISDAALTQAQGVLSPAQLTALQDYQKELRTQQELARSLRNRNAPAAPPAGAAR